MPGGGKDLDRTCAAQSLLAVMSLEKSSTPARGRVTVEIFTAGDGIKYVCI